MKLLAEALFGLAVIVVSVTCWLAPPDVAALAFRILLVLGALVAALTVPLG